MAQTIVKKALITMQDIAIGTGKVRQRRGGKLLELDEVPIMTQQQVLDISVKTADAALGRSIESRLQNIGGVFTTIDNLKARRGEVGAGEIVRVHGADEPLDGGGGWFLIARSSTPIEGYIHLGDDLYAKRGS